MSIFWFIIHLYSIHLTSSQTELSVDTTSPKFSISWTEAYHLYLTLILSLWLMLSAIIAYGIYDCRLRAQLVNDETVLQSHVYTISIIAAEPSLAYDYDNSSIRLDLIDRNDDLIASLLMRPLWAFHSIQPKPDATSMANTPKVNPNADESETKNLSRQVPLIGVFKLISDKKMKKVHTIAIGHDCQHPNASVLVRCVDISDITSLVSHTYPLNAYVKHIAIPLTFTFDLPDTQLEFDGSHQRSRRYLLRANSSLNPIERAVCLLVCLNMIVLCSYFWTDRESYEENSPSIMWSRAIPLSLVLGSLVAVIHLIITLSFRLFKEYNVFNRTNRIVLIEWFAIISAILLSLLISITSLIFAYNDIRIRTLLQWYRIAFLSALVFLILSFVLALIANYFHIKAKQRNEDSLKESTLYIPNEGEKQAKHPMIELDSNLIEIKNIKHLTIFSSTWVKRALDQHKGLDKSILCDVYEVMYLPKGGVVTNLAANAAQLFGEENVKENTGATYATRIIEQKGMAVSISQYGRNKRADKKSKDVVVRVDSGGHPEVKQNKTEDQNKNKVQKNKTNP